jgi:AcrR family transcriptional regulator
MGMRSSILEATAALLAQSSNADVSTRAVCEASGVQQPVLYRLFGDKDGLLAAAVDYGFEQYLASKRATVASDDPVADLRSGWDAHTAFALSHPNLYRLMYTPGLKAVPDAVGEAHGLLRTALDRCAAVGRLAISSDIAAQLVMSANSGIALALITRPEIYHDPRISERVRDAVFATILTADGDAQSTAGLASAAATIASALRNDPPAALSPGERELLAEWMTRLADPHEGFHRAHPKAATEITDRNHGERT